MVRSTPGEPKLISLYSMNGLQRKGAYINRYTVFYLLSCLFFKDGMKKFRETPIVTIDGEGDKSGYPVLE